MAEESTQIDPLNNQGSQDYIRKSPRVPLSVFVEETGTTMPLCFALNVSTSGMLVEMANTSTPPSEQTQLKLRFHLPFSDRAIQTQALIRSVRKQKSFSGEDMIALGIEFVELSDEDRAIIQNYVDRYHEAQKAQAQAIKNETSQSAQTVYQTKPLSFFQECAEKLIPKTEPPMQAGAKRMWQVCNDLTVHEKAILTGGQLDVGIPDDLADDPIEKLRNALLLYLKVTLEAPRIQSIKDDPAQATLIQAFEKVVTFEVDGAIEGLQQIQTKAVATDNKPLKSLCVQVRQRLSNAAMDHKKASSGGDDEKKVVIAENLEGPWGVIHNLSVYQTKVEKFFQEQLEDPIEQGEYKNYLKGFPDLVHQHLKEKNPEWSPVLKAVALFCKLTDELERLRRIEGKQYEHLDTIRAIFKRNSQHVSEIHGEIKSLFELNENKKPRKEDEEKREAVIETNRLLLEAYSQTSDFTNRLIPGAVSISNENVLYDKGQFRAALDKKAKAVKKWVIRRQRRLIYATIIVALLGAAYHGFPYIKILLRQPVAMGEFQPPYTVLESHVDQGEVVIKIKRTEWLAMKEEDRKIETASFLNRLRQQGHIGLRILDEKKRELVRPTYMGNEVSLVYEILEEENPNDNLDASGR